MGLLESPSRVLSGRGEGSGLCLREKIPWLLRSVNGVVVTSCKDTATVHVKDKEGLTPRQCLGKERKKCL